VIQLLTFLRDDTGTIPTLSRAAKTSQSAKELFHRGPPSFRRLKPGGSCGAEACSQYRSGHPLSACFFVLPVRCVKLAGWPLPYRPRSRFLAPQYPLNTSAVSPRRNNLCQKLPAAFPQCSTAQFQLIMVVPAAITLLKPPAAAPGTPAGCRVQVVNVESPAMSSISNPY